MAVDGRTVIPATVLESLETIQADYRDVECNLKRVLAACDPDVLVQLPPLDRANTFFILAKAVATLFTLRLRCSGESPEEHPVMSELDRLDLYESKIEHYIDKSKAPCHPTTTINAPAATRFIEHSLPDLTPEQRRDMRGISRGEGHRNKSRENRHSKKKRKQEAAEKQSVAAAAAAFLVEASKKLFDGGNLQERKEEEESEEAPCHPTTTINAPAATRFIEHSLPDLTPEQRRDMRGISRGEGHRNKSRENRHSKKKRKQEAAEKQSVAAAAAAFLVEASKKLFDGGNLQERKEEEESEEGEM